ncbi:hypothetical protein ACFWEJ_11010 [Promicromonospora sp. NPDC060204]|uniref:hypothetical protein n=1 Tax=Promicromonospora sp. NPDC060204 TaxID=3347071 RepID=UPI003659359F
MTARPEPPDLDATDLDAIDLDATDLDATDLDATVDALYTQPLDGFVAARDAAARKVADGGDRLGAERIKRLPKPSVAAWVINHVVRERPDDVAALTAVGDELRAATQDRDRARIKALDHLRRERTEALVGVVRDAGEVDGRPVSAAVLDRLTETLTAAVMDADAGAAVRAGRLSRGLQHAGFGIVDELGEEADLVTLRPDATEAETAKSGATAADAAAADTAEKTAGATAGATEGATEGATAASAEESTEPDSDAAERAVEETSAQVDRLEARRDDASDRLHAADAAVEHAEGETTRLDEEVARLTAERDAAHRALDEARAEADGAHADLTAVEDELDDAEERAAQARRRRRRAARGR